MKFNTDSTITKREFEAISYDLNNLLFYIDTEIDDDQKEMHLRLTISALKILGDIVRRDAHKKDTFTIIMEGESEILSNNINTLVAYVGGTEVIDRFIAQKTDKEFTLWLDRFFTNFLKL